MKTYVIAEMAWSHTGSLGKAIEMLEGATESGADAISIHITDMPTYMTKDYKCIAGTTLSDSADETLSIYDFLVSINLSDDDWKRFSCRADELNIDLVVMCNDQQSFEFSKKINVKKFFFRESIQSASNCALSNKKIQVFPIDFFSGT